MGYHRRRPRGQGLRARLPTGLLRGRRPVPGSPELQEPRLHLRPGSGPDLESPTRGGSSVGRARASQARGRGFETRPPLLAAGRPSGGGGGDGDDTAGASGYGTFFLSRPSLRPSPAPSAACSFRRSAAARAAAAGLVTG